MAYLLKGKSLNEIKPLLGNSENWINDVMRKSTTNPNGGWVLREITGSNLTGRNIQFHPGTHRHFNGNPYWKVSSPKGGVVRIPATR